MEIEMQFVTITSGLYLLHYPNSLVQKYSILFLSMCASWLTVLMIWIIYELTLLHGYSKYHDAYIFLKTLPLGVQ